MAEGRTIARMEMQPGMGRLLLRWKHLRPEPTFHPQWLLLSQLPSQRSIRRRWPLQWKVWKVWMAYEREQQHVLILVRNKGPVSTRQAQHVVVLVQKMVCTLSLCTSGRIA